MNESFRTCLAAALLLAAPVIGQQNQTVGSESAGSEDAMLVATVGPADRILSSLTDPQLQLLVSETLERNPEVARVLAQARAADRRAPQVRALPDPVVGVTAWLRSPETRTGPQVLTLNWTQGLPWLSRFDLKEQTAILEASALFQDAEAIRLGLVTEVRQLYYELAFLLKRRGITLDYLDHLCSTRRSLNRDMRRASAPARMWSRFKPRSPWRRISCSISICTVSIWNPTSTTSAIDPPRR